MNSKFITSCHPFKGSILIVWAMTKTRQESGMTDRISVVYIEIRTEMSWSIEQDVVCLSRKEDKITTWTIV